MSSYIKAVATDLTQLTGQDMQAALQNALNDNFSGDLAVRVTLDGDGELGFEKVSGSGSISIQEADTDGGGDGTFVATFIDSSGDIDFNYYQDVDGGTFTGDVAYSATRDTAATSYFRTTFSTGSEVKADRVVAFTDEGTSAAGAITLSGDTIEVELGNTGVTTTIELLDGTYNTLEDLVAMVNDRIQASGAFQGTDAIRLAVYDGVDQDDLTTPVRLLALESVYGKKIDITAFAALFGAEEDSFIDDTTILRELGISPDVTDGSYATHGRIAGGIDTAATNGVVSIEVVDGANTISRQVSLATLDTNVSFETFMSDLVVAANAAFAADGLSFNGATSGSGATFALNQSGGKVMTLSGQIVDQAFGASVSAVGSDGDYRNLASMDDVVAEINEDLAGVAAATYDNSTGTLTFQALDGVVGATSTISLSGDRLTALNFGSSLEGIGTDGNAEAASIADISVGTYDDALAALTSIDNALSYVSKEMSKLGAIQNRLDHTVSNLTNIVTNTEASRSRIMDTDYGAESASLARSQIIQQAATAMLAQANQSAQSVLSLLQ
jgi:flagellin